MTLRRMLWRCDRVGMRLEWRFHEDGAECRIYGRRDVAGFGSNGAEALADLMSRLGAR